MVDPAVLIAAFAVILVAAFVQGVTGFAHALLAIGLLSMLFGSQEAILILSLLAPVICLPIFLKVRKYVRWKEVLAIALPLCLVGTPLGILAFEAIDKALLTKIVGGLLVVFAGFFLSPWAPRPRELHIAVPILAGFMGGFLSGLASTGGPPIVLYLYAREMPKRERMAVLQGVFVLGSIVKVVMLLFRDLLTTPIALHSAILAPAVLIGVFAGRMLFNRIPAEALRKAALLLLVAIGINLLI